MSEQQIKELERLVTNHGERCCENNEFGHQEREDAIESKLRELVGWQPIETAPKDFTEFDGWNGQRITDVYWGPREGNPKGEKTWVHDVYETNHGWVVEEVFSLTHWMKKPEAPQ